MEIKMLDPCSDEEKKYSFELGTNGDNYRVYR